MMVQVNFKSSIRKKCTVGGHVRYGDRNGGDAAVTETKKQRIQKG